MRARRSCPPGRCSPLTATNAPPCYETIAEAAARTGVCTKTIRRRIAEGRLTGYRFGPTLIRLDPAQVDGLLHPIPTTDRVAS